MAAGGWEHPCPVGAARCIGASELQMKGWALGTEDVLLDVALVSLAHSCCALDFASTFSLCYVVIFQARLPSLSRNKAMARLSKKHHIA